MELRLDMCQKLLPYIYKTVTLETVSHGSLVGNPVQTDIMRSVLTMLLPNGQMDIPLDDILSVSCFGMETLWCWCAAVFSSGRTLGTVRHQSLLYLSGLLQ